MDAEKETIELISNANQQSINEFREYLTMNMGEPSFFFFRFDHSFDGGSFSPVLFIFFCPENSKVKLKMLYSTVKSAALDHAKTLSLSVDRKLEISEADELLSENDLVQELHPENRQVKVKTGFARPSRPGKGPSRVTRNK